MATEPRDPPPLDQPTFHVVIPVRNGAETLGACLAGLYRSEYPASRFHVTCVDDGSDDRTPEILAHYPCEVLTNTRPRGAAAARNRAACLDRGEILLFIDADTVVRPRTLSLLAGRFAGPAVASVIGTHDSRTRYPNLASAYKNLFVARHFALKGEEVEVFYCCIGAVRRTVFERVGGFDERFEGASVEDFEFGLRLTARGALTVLAREIEVDHIKHLGIRALLRQDFQRARGQTSWAIRHGRLLGGTAGLPAPMALGYVFAAVSAGGVALSLAGGGPPAWALTSLGFVGFTVTQRPILGEVRRQRGVAQALLTVPLALADTIAGAAGIGVGAFEAVTTPRSPKEAAG